MIITIVVLIIIIASDARESATICFYMHIGMNFCKLITAITA